MPPAAARELLCAPAVAPSIHAEPVHLPLQVLAFVTACMHGVSADRVCARTTKPVALKRGVVGTALRTGPRRHTGRRPCRGTDRPSSAPHTCANTAGIDVISCGAPVEKSAFWAKRRGQARRPAARAPRTCRRQDTPCSPTRCAAKRARQRKRVTQGAAGTCANTEATERRTGRFRPSRRRLRTPTCNGRCARGEREALRCAGALAVRSRRRLKKARRLAEEVLNLTARAK
jgi:hypothetical protein